MSRIAGIVGSTIERCTTTTKREKQCRSSTLEIWDGTEFDCKGCDCHDALTAALVEEACSKP